MFKQTFISRFATILMYQDRLRDLGYVFGIETSDVPLHGGLAYVPGIYAFSEEGNLSHVGGWWDEAQLIRFEMTKLKYYV